MRITAALLRQPKTRLALETLTLADPQAHEVRVRVMATGLCHSDLHVIEGDMAVPLPTVLGHEGAGIVEAVGPGVVRVKPGDHVALSWAPECGVCRFCVGGRPNLCTASAPRVLDGTLLDGSLRLADSAGAAVYHYSFLSTFAEAAVVPEASCIAIDRAVPFAPASLVGCAVMTGIGAAVNTARIRPGSAVAVLGLGGVGLNVIQGAMLCGAERIIGIDTNPAKRAVAERFGLTDFIDPGAGPLVDQLRQSLGGGLVDYAFEAIGHPAAMRTAYDITERGGMVVYIGIAPDGSHVKLPATRLPREEKIVTGSFYGGARPLIDFPKILSLYAAGRIKLDELISARLPMSRINEGFDLVRRGDALRVVVEPGA
jgi:S-(hydroxymethyl)glutathione dehydrogenase/alcohol dehydrogenase